jgi:hypothetical protein
LPTGRSPRTGHEPSLAADWMDACGRLDAKTRAWNTVSFRVINFQVLTEIWRSHSGDYLACGLLH